MKKFLAFCLFAIMAVSPVYGSTNDLVTCDGTYIYMWCGQTNPAMQARCENLTLSITNRNLPVIQITNTYTALRSDLVIICNPAADFILTLPAAASFPRKWYRIKNVHASNDVRIDANAAETIDGATNYLLNSQYQTLDIVCDGDEWHIF